MPKYHPKLYTEKPNGGYGYKYRNLALLETWARYWQKGRVERRQNNLHVYPICDVKCGEYCFFFCFVFCSFFPFFIRRWQDILFRHCSWNSEQPVTSCCFINFLPTAIVYSCHGYNLCSFDFMQTSLQQHAVMRVLNVESISGRDSADFDWFSSQDNTLSFRGDNAWFWQSALLRSPGAFAHSFTSRLEDHGSKCENLHLRSPDSARSR